MYILYVLLLYSCVHCKTIGLDGLSEGRNGGLSIDLVSQNGVELHQNELPPPALNTHRLPPAECPPCVCLLEDHLVARPQILPGIRSQPTQSTQPVTTSTTTSTATTSPPSTTTTTTTTTTSSTTSLPPVTEEDNTSTVKSSPEEERLKEDASSKESSKDSGASSSCPQPEKEELCLTESCILASGTILSSLDRKVDPCQDFYKFSCGGWEQRIAVSNIDRFQTIDRRNQNILSSILQEPDQDDSSQAEIKTRAFYKSCTQDKQTTIGEDLSNLQTVIEFTGGWNISGEYNATMDTKERLYRIQNQLGVSALFTWGVVPENNTNYIAIVPGGWVEEYLQDPESYGKLMLGIASMLQESSKCPSVEYVYDVDLDLNDGETVNDTVEIDYEYSYDIETSELPDLFAVFKQVFWPSSATTAHEYFYPDLNLTEDGDSYTKWDYENEVERSGGYGVAPGGDGDLDGGRHQDGGLDGGQQGSGPHRSTQPINYFPTSTAEPESRVHRTSREECIRKIATDKLLNQTQQLQGAIRSILMIEQKLRNLSFPAENEEVKLTPVYLKHLEKSFPFLDWFGFFSRAFQIIDHDLPEDTKILVDLRYLHGLQELVSNLEVVDLHNYLVWRLVVSFYPSKYGDEDRRREACLKQTENVFGPVVTAMYVKHKTVAWSQQVVEEVDVMVDSMKEAFRHNMDKISWMSNSSRLAAKEKLSGMMDLIGYPQQVLNSTWLNIRYNEVEVTDDYLMNIIAFQSHERKEGLKLYVKEYERGTWSETSHGGSIVTINAFYSPNSNTMIVPIGMLQDPLYWSKPKSLTFGAFGIVVAHEITHAFDDEGINFNDEGVAGQLYDQETIDAFHAEADCIRKQYSNYNISDIHIDGNRTLTENLADHGGLKMALSAYKTWKAKNKDSRLPALPFTDEQLFFLGYALPWCATYSSLNEDSHLFKDEHSPGKFRVLGPLSNNEDFARAWNCPVGSNMNPRNKCSVW